VGVAHFDSMSALPTALNLSGEGDLQPIKLYYGELRLKKGGKVDKAAAMKAAGRNGDTEMIHVNKEELAELVKMWGPPSINPQTGLPEFFLKKVWKKVKKVVKPLASIAQIALPFIPSIGPIASVALGAGLGGITGGLKGALGGAATGAIGGGLGGKLGTKLGVGKLGGNALVGALGGAGGGIKGMASGALTGGIAGGLGEELGAKLPGNMDPRVKTALANALLGGAAAGVGGGDPMMGALGTGLASYWTKQGMPSTGPSATAPAQWQAGLPANISPQPTCPGTHRLRPPRAASRRTSRPSCRRASRRRCLSPRRSCRRSRPSRSTSRRPGRWLWPLLPGSVARVRPSRRKRRRTRGRT